MPEQSLSSPAAPLTKQGSPVSQHILDSRKRMLFITGRAGTGKSTLLKHLVSKTRRNFVVLAPTGAAAVEVNGQTIHSFFRFKPGITVEEAFKMGDKSYNQIYRRLEIIIIDEISMVRADLLDCIDAFLQGARKKDEPFGGVQIIVFGDLYQLEPVVTRDEISVIQMRYDTPYFFSADVMQQLVSNTREQQIEFIELTTIYRQSDPEFIEVLDRIRRNNINFDTLDYLNRQVDEYLELNREGVIYLTDTNALAQRINNQNLKEIDAEEQRYTGRIIGDFNTKSLPTEMELYLKPGARIMLINNDMHKRWVNGTLGTVTGLQPDKIVVQLDSGTEYAIERYTWGNYKFFYDPQTHAISKKEIGTYEQFPIRLAWAMTIHKSQGKTFDNVVILLQNRSFAHGQVYVALSRCRTKEGITLSRPLQEFDIISDKRVREFLARIKWYIAAWKWPVDARAQAVKKAIQSNQFIKLRHLSSDDVSQTMILRDLRLEEDFENGTNLLIVTGVSQSDSERVRIPLQEIVSFKIADPQEQLENA